MTQTLLGDRREVVRLVFARVVCASKLHAWCASRICVVEELRIVPCWLAPDALSSHVPVASHEAPLCACGVVEPRRDGSVPSTWSSSAPNLTELPVSAVLCSGSLGNVPVALHVRIGRLPVCPLSDGRLKHMEPVLARQIH